MILTVRNIHDARKQAEEVRKSAYCIREWLLSNRTTDSFDLIKK